MQCKRHWNVGMLFVDFLQSNPQVIEHSEGGGTWLQPWGTPRLDDVRLYSFSNPPTPSEKGSSLF